MNKSFLLRDLANLVHFHSERREKEKGRVRTPALVSGNPVFWAGQPVAKTTVPVDDREPPVPFTMLVAGLRLESPFL